jgi:hypothetical protein
MQNVQAKQLASINNVSTPARLQTPVAEMLNAKYLTLSQLEQWSASASQDTKEMQQ